MECPDPPEYKYVQLSFIEAKKTNFEKIENRHLFLSSPVKLTQEP